MNPLRLIVLGLALALLPAAAADEVDDRLAELWKVLGFDPGAGDPNVARPWLGVGLEDSADPPGVELTSVAPGSPAAKAGLAPGDVVLEYGGRSVVGEGSPGTRLAQAVTASEVGARVEVVVQRGDQRRTIEVRLEARPVAEAPGREHPELPAPVPMPDWARTALDDEGRRVFAEIARTTTWRSDGGAFGGPADPFRTREVTALLARPLRAPHVSAALARELAKAGPSEAIRILADRLDSPFDPLAEPRERPARLSGWLEALKARFLEARERREAALAGLPAEDRAFLVETGGRILTGLAPAESRRFLGLAAARRDALTAIFQEAARTARLLESLDPAALEIDLPAGASARPGVLGEVLLDEDWDGIGRVVVGGPGPNRYAGQFAILVDVGGDDLYAGVSGPPGADSVLFDIAGDDVHRSGSRAQGHAVLAASFLFDLAGDDLYDGDDEVQGVGVLGVGLLVDRSGDDRYSADRATQGAGLLGIGILLDASGLDRYSAYQFAQGFGFVRGAGLLADASGNDVYSAAGKYEDFREPGLATASLSQGFGFGLRPWGERDFGGAGGIGLLVDAAGHDVYHADYFAQGASYWYALGVLYDGDGRDRYVANRYSQGAGIHLSVGVLVDAGGDDHYAAPAVGVSQGCGHDWAAGFLVDLAGRDEYVSGVLSQGAGNDNGLGLLVDLAGDDSYRARDQSQGHGTMSAGRGYGSLGVLLDQAGADRYDLGGADGKEVKRERWGYCLDR